MRFLVVRGYVREVEQLVGLWKYWGFVGAKSSRRADG